MSPTLARKPCTTPGCRNLTGQRRCRDCRRKRERTRPQRQPLRQLYKTARWRRLRELVLRDQPLCDDCGTAESVAVDHRRRPGSWAEFWDRENLRGLCVPCHGRKTVTEDGGFGRAKR